MRITIQAKLMTTYIIISLFTALFMYLLTYLTSEQRLRTLTLDYQLQEMVREVENWYQIEYSLEGFREYFHTLHPRKENSEKQQATDQGEVSTPKRVVAHSIVDKNRKALLPYLHFKIGDRVADAYFLNSKPVIVDKQVVAWVLPADEVGISMQTEMLIFFDNLNEILIVSLLITLLGSIVTAVLLARFFLRSIHSLTQASSAIAKGELKQNVAVISNDEIGDLSIAFNQMSHDLAVSDKQRRQLTADITHELGTPVQVISGYVEMAQQGVFELDKNRINTIAIELEHIKRSIKDMSLLAETDDKTLPLDISTIDVNALLERLKTLYSQLCSERNINFIVDCADQTDKVELDEERMVQVLSNLISNAIRYTPKEGIISLKVRFDIQTEALKKVVFSVQDDGCGINEKDLPFIFNRFYRAEASRCGSAGKMGLGLAITKGLVEMQGGEISVSSAGEGRGSCFKVSFPI